MVEFSQELLAYLHRSPDTFVSFPAHQDELFLSLEEVILENNWLSQTSLLSRAMYCGIRSSRSLNRPQSALLKSKAVMLFFVLLPPLRILNSTIPRSLQSKLPLTFTSPTHSSLFVNTRSRLSAKGYLHSFSVLPLHDSVCPYIP